MTNTKLPKSAATNAYDLLSDVSALALEEPKRMRMEVPLVCASNRAAFGISIDALPACGTVGCIGGWTAVLRGPEHVTGYDALRAAAVILGLDQAQAYELFWPSELLSDADTGTLSHAYAVADHIREFQQKYADQLKAKAV
jgi:hypothetical protein